MIWPPHGPSLLQVEELSRIEVDPEEKTSKAHQSLVLVRGASCGLGWWIGLSFLNFPPPAMPENVLGIASLCWLQEEMEELKCAETRSQPSFHHGNGPYNDVNIPGCWFFKLPHKASWGSWGSSWPHTTAGTCMISPHGVGWGKSISVAGTGGCTELC